MKVEIATICDAATDQQGKLNVLGCFDTLYAAYFPVVHPYCAIAYRVRFEPGEQGEHSFAVRIIDQRGQPLVPPIEGGIQVQGIGADSSALNLVFGLNNLEISQPGHYTIVLMIDGREQSGIPLIVHRPDQPQAITARTA